MGKDEVLCIETGYEDAETCGIFVTLLVTQGFSGKDSGGGICGVKSRDEGDEDCDAGDEKAVDKARCKRNVVDGIDLGREANDLVMSGQKADGIADDQAEEGTNDADEDSL